MRFVEINLFGVYVAPMSLMLVAAWMVTIGLRRVAALRAAASFVAPGAVHLRDLRDRPIVDRFKFCTVRSLCLKSPIRPKSKQK